MAQEDNAKRIEEAKKLSKDQPAKAEQIYKDILSKQPGTNDRAAREFESALMGLGELYRDHKRTQDLATLIQQTRDVLTSFARAKTAKLGMEDSIQSGADAVLTAGQSDSSSTSSPPSPTPLTLRSPSPSPASTGPSRSGRASCARTSKSALSVYIWPSNPTTMLSPSSTAC